MPAQFGKECQSQLQIGNRSAQETSASCDDMAATYQMSIVSYSRERRHAVLIIKVNTNNKSHNGITASGYIKTTNTN